MTTTGRRRGRADARPGGVLFGARTRW